MQIVITAGYWVGIAGSAPIDFKYPETLMGTFFMHGGLLVSLIIEWMFNSRLFNITRSTIYLFFIYVVYTFMYYASYDFLGFYPYAPNIVLDAWTPLYVSSGLLTGSLISIATGLFTNLIKGGFTVSNP